MIISIQNIGSFIKKQPTSDTDFMNKTHLRFQQNFVTLLITYVSNYKQGRS